MIDDEEKSHLFLVEDLHLTRKIHKSIETKGIKDEQNQMNKINTDHRYFKRFMRSHGGYSREGLQDWCTLFSFMYNHGGNIAGAIKELLELMISNQNVLRYRDVMSKNPQTMGK